MKKQFSDYKKEIKPIFYFVVLLFSTHFIWIFAIDADVNSHQIAICGYDVSHIFYKISVITAMAVHWLLENVARIKSLINDTVIIAGDNATAPGIRVLWSCSGVKQLFMFLTIFLLYPGPKREKFWYIPLGCIILIIFNLFRICVIAIKTTHDGMSFAYWHSVFNYPVYLIIFVLWLIWQEKYNIIEK